MYCHEGYRYINLLLQNSVCLPLQTSVILYNCQSLFLSLMGYLGLLYAISHTTSLHIAIYHERYYSDILSHSKSIVWEICVRNTKFLGSCSKLEYTSGIPHLEVLVFDVWNALIISMHGMQL